LCRVTAISIVFRLQIRPKSGVQFEIGIDFRQKLNVLRTSRGTTVYSGQGAGIVMQSLEFILTGTLLYVQMPSVEKHSQLPRTRSWIVATRLTSV